MADKNVILKDSSDNLYPLTKGFTYTTTAPTEDNNDGVIKVVVLQSEPATTYKGYMYIILEQA